MNERVYYRLISYSPQLICSFCGGHEHTGSNKIIVIYDFSLTPKLNLIAAIQQAIVSTLCKGGRIEIGPTR
jgi:hypothetical protein